MLKFEDLTCIVTVIVVFCTAYTNSQTPRLDFPSQPRLDFPSRRIHSWGVNPDNPIDIKSTTINIDQVDDDLEYEEDDEDDTTTTTSDGKDPIIFTNTTESNTFPPPNKITMKNNDENQKLSSSGTITEEAIMFFVQERMVNATELEIAVVKKLYHFDNFTGSPISKTFRNFVNLHYNVSRYQGIRWQGFGQPCKIDTPIHDKKQTGHGGGFSKPESSKRVPHDGWMAVDMTQRELAMDQIISISSAIQVATVVSPKKSKEASLDFLEDKFLQDFVENQLPTRKEDNIEEQVDQVVARILYEPEYKEAMKNTFNEQKTILKELQDICSHLDYLICIPNVNLDPSDSIQGKHGQCACRDGFVEENQHCYVPLREDCNRNNLFLSHDLKVLPSYLLDQIRTPTCVGNAECLNDFVCDSVPNFHLSNNNIFILLFLHFPIYLI